MDLIMEQSIVSSVNEFWNAVRIYYEHPSCINKQVVLSKHIYSGTAKNKDSFHEVRDSTFSFCGDSCSFLKEKSTSIKINSFLPNTLVREDVSNVFEELSGVHLCIRELIPKKNFDDFEFYECFVLDKEKTKLEIYTQYIPKKKCHEDYDCKKRDPLSILKFNHIEVTHNVDTLKLLVDETVGDKGVHWLKVIFFPKFMSLLCNVQKAVNLNCNKKNSKKLDFSNRVDLVTYYKVYEEMKSKYANKLIENWIENTDPKKFVYEDIGIATYLMLLWNGNNSSLEKAKKQKFVDLGCGNGLLVHILNSEGHQGLGLDLRKRKIWDTFPLKTKLKEEVVIPSVHTIYPDADWVIGNHSDELTPWIPIIANLSNNYCQYFVLPCCPYQLNGNKFQRKDSSLSSYLDFIKYIKNISELCDFETYIDKLRIPSTKRICLIGQRKVTSDISVTHNNISTFIYNECQSVNSEKFKGERYNLANSKIKIREPAEKVKNCTKLPALITDQILKLVMEKLLSEKCNIKLVRNNKDCIWNRGGKLTVETLAKSIGAELLQELKKECKGLQTLLKNNHYIFEVSKGMVQFRSPCNMKEISYNFLQNGDKSKWKNRNCWFYLNHPDKCPLSDEICSYNHV